MILDDTTTLSTGATAGDKKTENVATIISKANESPMPTKVNAINSNTFVVKLKDSPENGSGNLSPRTNLLKLFSENRSSSNVSVVKALGIGRIVVNRTLLKNPKHKSSTSFQRKYNPSVLSSSSHSAATPISVKIPSDTMKTTPSKSPIFIRSRPQSVLSNGKENETHNRDKKDDDISGNLANFMHFKLSNIVAPPIKSEYGGGKTFKVNMLNSIEVVLPRAVESTQAEKETVPKEEKTYSDSQESDNDLTSLSWLTDKSLLKTIRSCNPDDVGISLSGDETDEEEDDVECNDNKAVFTAKSKVERSGKGGFAARQYGQSYNHHDKPPYSFSCLIFMAVEDSIEKKLPVKEIYSWVCKHFPYFYSAPSGWKNSIRHNLSLNKCFKKADLGKNAHDAVGKGALWCIDPAYRPNLIQALKRTPFYPFLYPSGIGQPLSLNNLASLLPGVRSGRVPSWSPNMFSSKSTQFTDPDVASAALNLLGLKGNDSIEKQSPSVKSTLQELAAEIFNQNSDTAGTIPLIITDPAEDHTYSTMSFVKTRSSALDERCTSPESDKSAPDAAYEFETCGTDIDSDVDIEMMSNGGASECDLGDSGFSSLRGGRKRKNLTSEKSQNKRRKSSNSLERKSEKSVSSRKSSSKAKVSSPKRNFKVRFQPKKKTKSSTKTIIRKSKTEDVMSSDVDSGKDSPKVECKSRSRIRTKTRLVETTSRKKEKKVATVTKANPNSPYGTRSRSQTRHSKRIAASDHGNILERASARKRRQDSISFDDIEEEEIKLAAGSLLHLAGFRSPPSSSQNNP